MRKHSRIATSSNIVNTKPISSNVLSRSSYVCVQLWLPEIWRSKNGQSSYYIEQTKKIQNNLSKQTEYDIIFKIIMFIIQDYGVFDDTVFLLFILFLIFAGEIGEISWGLHFDFTRVEKSEKFITKYALLELF